MTYISSGLILIHPPYLNIIPFSFQGLHLLELATNLEQKATYLKWEGLGHIKIVLASTDTSSFLEILQAHFGQAALSIQVEKEDVHIEEEEGTSEETKAEKTKKIGNLATVQLVFPFKSIPLIVAASPQISFLCTALKPSNATIVSSPVWPWFCPKGCCL